MKIYVVRHGETNAGYHRVIADTKELLNERGKRQAIQLGKELNEKQIDMIYCSPLQRA